MKKTRNIAKKQVKKKLRLKEEEKKPVKRENKKREEVMVSSSEPTIKINPFNQDNGSDADFFEVGIMANAMDFKKAPQEALAFNLEGNIQDAPSSRSTASGNIEYGNSQKDYFEIKPGEFQANNIDIYNPDNNGANRSYTPEASMIIQPRNERAGNNGASLGLARFVDPYANPSNKNPEAPQQISQQNYEPVQKERKIRD